jgi:hypothetical protein
MNTYPGSKAIESLAPLYHSIRGFETIDEYESFIQTVPREELLVLAALLCDGQVCNGRFRQFFRNSTGNLAPEAADGFELLGFPDCAKALRDAMSLFGDTYPRAYWERHRILEELEFPGGDPKLVTEYDADVNAILNRMHLATRKPMVEPFAAMDYVYFSAPHGSSIGDAADQFIDRMNG